jgi:hypothetical protein
VKVNPGKPDEAEAYYNDVITKLKGFPQTTLQNSRIGDMLVYYGFPALLASDIEKLDPAVLMDFERLSNAVSNRSDFGVVYRNNPLRTGEIVASRFFTPKIINVRDPQVTASPTADSAGAKSFASARATTRRPAAPASTTSSSSSTSSPRRQSSRLRGRTPDSCREFSSRSIRRPATIATSTFSSMRSSMHRRIRSGSVPSS